MYGVWLEIINRDNSIISTPLGIFSNLEEAKRDATKHISDLDVDDGEKICALMRLYRHYYRVIGAVVLGVGMSVFSITKPAVMRPLAHSQSFCPRKRSGMACCQLTRSVESITLMPFSGLVNSL